MRIFSFMLSVLALLMISSATLSAQDILVKGKILDKRDRAVAGTNILVEGTHTGTVANAHGDFTLKLDEGKHTLMISMIGYNTIEHKVTVEKDHEYRLNVVLTKETSMSKSEVVFEKVKD